VGLPTDDPGSVARAHLTETESNRPVPTSLHLALALDGAGWHPAAWRMEAAQPTELLKARYWANLVGEAEKGLMDFVTIEDSLGVQSSFLTGADDRIDQVRGRLDAVLVAAAVAPSTAHVGLVPTVVITHTEPFHISKAIATLDYASLGRAGVRVRVSARADETGLFGRREPISWNPASLVGQSAPGALGELFEEAADYVEVVRRLWDSWEDDAEIRDAASGRFIDRSKLHYIGFEGRWFSVKGPSITPRPPQGQPIVSALAHNWAGYELIGRAADVGYVTPRTADDARSMVEAIRGEQEASGRAAEILPVFADLVVFLDPDPAVAADRKARLDELAGEEWKSDALVYIGSPPDLADLLQEWQATGLSGFRLRPGTVPRDLEAITRGLVPQLQARGVFRRSYEATTLRGLLGMTRPANRYVLVNQNLAV
jgi:alkanesulfonate monooxygenase SsuD/methylene tetrahydromethanopterin reductase-like flavin-dependent oxidoreductase (luciferase family)